MHLSNFFRTAKMPFCEAFKFNYEIGTRIEITDSNKFIPKLQGIFFHSEYNNHYAKVEHIVQNIYDKLYDIDPKLDFSFITMLQASLNQLVKNTMEHNPNHNQFGALGYYMAQKTLYNTIEFAFSDVGQGFRNRMLEMLKMKDSEAIEKYSQYEAALKDNTYLFQQHKNNPNLIAITLAVDFRSDSEIPGLFQIKQFAINKGGSLIIHSGNYMVKYEDSNLTSKYLNTYFSGCHLKLEFPLTRKHTTYEY